MQFSDFVGQEIVVLIKQISPTLLQKVTLLGVENGGIWVHSQELTNKMLSQLGHASAPTSMAFFYPYCEISFAMKNIPGIALNETAFGL
jgi:hypothetical protein